MKLNGLISALLLLSLLFSACGGESKNDEKETKEVEQEEVANEAEDVQKSLINALEKMSEGTTHKKAETCDEYLENFEKWAEKYIAVLEKVADNSADMSAIMEMGTLAPELAQWTMEWENMAKCSEDPEFVKEHEEIVKRIEVAADKIEKK